MKNKIRIGTVADLFNISKQTLIHYDRIGLLKPSFVEDNHYRYYTFNDLDRLDMIINLKKTGLSLKEIQNYLKSPSLDDSIDLLANQQTCLENHIAELLKTKRRIDYKIEELKNIKHLKPIVHPTIMTKAERYILVQTINPDDDYDIMDAIRQLKHHVENSKEHYQFAHFFEGVMVKQKDLENKEFSKISKTFVFIDNDHHGIHEERISSGEFVCFHHYGPYEETYKSYETMLAFIEKSHLKVNGPSIEIPLINTWASNSDHGYITEIQIPVIPNFANNNGKNLSQQG